MSALPHPNQPSVTAVAPEAPVRLDYVDGLRGIAAFFVAIGHSVIGAAPGFTPAYLGAAASWQQVLFWPTNFGTQMVYLFLALSGFSLAYGELGRRAQGR